MLPGLALRIGVALILALLVRPAYAAEQAPGVHVVVAGETLSQIAAELGLDQDGLAQVNGLTDADALAIGQVLTLPSSAAVTPAPPLTPAPTPKLAPGVPAAPGAPAQLGGFYTLYEVQPGDTLDSIARWFGVKRDTIGSSGSLRPGALLTVPLSTSAEVLSPVPGNANLYPRGARGYDLSYPQGSGPFPAAPYAYGIVGVTRGRAFSQNPSLRQQLAWAQAGGNVSLYMNVNAPVDSTPAERISGPRICAGADQPTCEAYNYGWHAAQEAVAYAGSQGATTWGTWWLDIETANSWSTPEVNLAAINGASDGLKLSGVRSVGIYSSH
ncbi:MAG TPA: LysM peptidoglycan-binding domain-containing protein, partial [Chloroflexota bacterium]|nr:LysM peptidoglycan-binding domain-containing protein [Chloroflexota bacterium]